MLKSRKKDPRYEVRGGYLLPEVAAGGVMPRYKILKFPTWAGLNGGMRPAEEKSITSIYIMYGGYT
ncbi:hypothetical protein AD45P4_00145 [Alteromonas phage vB_AmaP_AD45-P4]|nr:hypothetical protein AD45P4_00145 [Alteromonas phage vB_AmaP_AD45-P4]